MGIAARRIRALAAVGCALGVFAWPGMSLAAVPAGSAAAGLPPGAPHVTFLHAGTVRGDGSAAVVQLAVTCPRSQGGFLLEISVQQHFSHGRPAIANGAVEGPCTGKAVVATGAVVVGIPPDNATFPQSFGKLVTGSADAVAFDYCDSGCNIDFQYPAQPVVLADTGRLDHLTGSGTGTSVTVDPAWRLVQGGRAASVTLHVTCPAGLAMGLGSALLASPSTGRHIQVSQESFDPQWTCSGRSQIVHATVSPTLPVSGTLLHAGAGFTDLFIIGPEASDAAEAWGQVVLS
jgi:hypothetical protein